MPNQADRPDYHAASAAAVHRNGQPPRIEENISLAPFTTLRIGGPARYFATIEDEAALWEANMFARDHNLPLAVLGGGSNLLVADAGFSGLILHLVYGNQVLDHGGLSTATLKRTDTKQGIFLDVAAGYDWDALVRYTCEQGICGMECLAGIPGLVGASPIQNIGAYGQEASQSIESVRALDRQTGSFTDISRKQCRFAYRSSIFNSTSRDRFFITGVRFRLSTDTSPNLTYADLAPLRGTNPTPLDVYHAVRAIRDRKGMVIDPTHPHSDTRSAGSFFRNPVVPASVFAPIAASNQDPVPHWPTPSGEVKLAAAWLIEQSGFPKGFTLGPVGISSRHTLALVNRTGTATCADLLHLRDTIIAAVASRFGVTLEQEPVYLA